MSFYDDVTEPETDEVTTTMPTTDATTLPEDHAPDADAAPAGNWLILLAPDGKITVGQMPAPEASDKLLAFHRQMFSDIPPDATPKGVLCMSRGNGAGSLQLHVYEGAAPGRDQLAKLRPVVLSRWAARIHTYGETRFEEDFPGLFGLKGQPAIIRTSSAIGDRLAASCIGKPIAHGIRPDGLRSGTSDMCDFAGVIEDARADDFGIVASLMILAPFAHWDLEDLDQHRALDAARLCLSYSASAKPQKTRWDLTVFDLSHASANRLQFTSLSHALGTCVVRRLELDEPLSARDFQPTEWRHLPRVLSAWAPSPVTCWTPAGMVAVPEVPFDVTATITPGAVNERVSASGTSTITTTSSTTADIPDMSQSVTTVAGDLVIVTLRMREIKIENLSTSPQNVTAFLEITDASNNVINGDADDHWTFPLSAAGGGAAFVVVPVNIVAFDSPGTGTQTYKGRWRVAGSVDSNVKVTNANSRRLQAIRTKR